MIQSFWIISTVQTRTAKRYVTCHHILRYFSSIQDSATWGVRMYVVMAKGDRREVGFQDGGCFLRFFKRDNESTTRHISRLG